MADNLTPKEEFLLNPVTEHNITDAAIASFETNFKHPLKVTVPITSTQDLHGMPNPYPTGASVNLIPDGTNTENGYVAGQYLVTDGTTTANTNYYVSEYFQISENTTYTWSNRVNTSVSPAICFYDENKTFISGININGQYSQTFTSPVGAVYCRSSQTTYTYQEASSVNAAYQLEVGETATAYRRYSNICPISGWTGANIFATAKNIMDCVQANALGSGVTVADGVLTAPTRNTTEAGIVFPVKPNTTYVVGFTQTTNAHIYIRCAEYSSKPTSYNSYVREILNEGTAQGTGAKARTITTGNEAKYVFFGFYRSYSTSKVVADSWFANLAGAGTMYEPYHGQTLPINWQTEAGTIYDGTVTLNEDGSADLVANLRSATISGSNVHKGTDYTNVSYATFALPPGSIGFYSHNNTIKVYCDRGEIYRPAGDFNNVSRINQLCIAASGSSLWFGFAVGTSEENMKTALDGMQIVYELVTPRTYHFPNVGQLKAFIGQNNVWSDLGNVDVKYLTQNSQTGIEYRGDRALELRRRAMIADSPHIHTTVGSSETGGLASFKSYVKAPVKKIEIPFSPKQDFNGYDFPWPGGGYVQLFNSATTTYGSKIDVNGTLTEDANYFVSDFIPVTASTYYYVSSEMPVVVGYNSSKELLQVIKNSGTSGAFQTPENCAYVRIQNYTEESNASEQASAAGTAYMCAGSEENQWYPYENICPISGWDGVNISHTGKNLVQLTTDMIVTAPWSSSKQVFKVYLPEGIYTGKFFGPNVYNYSYAYIYDKNGISISTDNIKFSTGTNYWYARTFTMPPNGGYLYIFRATNNPLVYLTDAMFCVVQGTTMPEEFIPYTGTTLPLIFNQSGDHAFLPTQEGTGDPSPENVRPIHPGLTFTRDDDSVLSIWGGTLTVNSDGSSDLVSEYISKTETGSGVSLYSGARMRVSAPGFSSPGSSIIANVKANYLKTATKASMGGNDWEISASDSGRAEVLIKFTYLINTVELVQKYLAENPLQIVYKLATPTTYTLSVAETNRALEALGLTQHIGPLYGGTVTINTDGSADVVSDIGKINVTGYALANVTAYGYYYARLVCSQYISSYDEHMYACNIATVKCTSLPSSLSNLTLLNAGTIGSTQTYLHCCIPTTLVDYDPEGSTSLVDCISRDLPIANWDVIAPLPVPQTYHFSNLEQLKVWLGENNFWCDISDDITVKYLNRG